MLLALCPITPVRRVVPLPIFVWQSAPRHHQERTETMNTITLRLKARRPRNPLAVPARQRHAGPHLSSKKADRQRERDAIRKEVNEHFRIPPSP